MTRITTNGFAHQRLDAFHVAMELVAGVERMASVFPKGYGDLKDQLRRSAAATARNIAEGANRSSHKDKAARFATARGECGECDATLEMAGVVGITPSREVARLRWLAARVGAMLTGLLRREWALQGGPTPKNRSPRPSGLVGTLPGQT